MTFQVRLRAAAGLRDDAPAFATADRLRDMGLDRLAERVADLAPPPAPAGHVYSGDTNPVYGGAWYDLSCWRYGYVDGVRVTDLDSGCGFAGAVLIERFSVGIGNPERIRKALKSCGPSDMRGFTREMARCAIAEALASYGYGDSEELETVQTEPDGPMVFDGWKATKRLRNADLKGYVEAVHLDK